MKADTARLLDNSEISFPLGLAVSSGMLPGWKYIEKFGINPAITSATDPEDIWQYGGIYTFSDTADISTISSGSVADIGIQVTIQGLGADWRELEQTVTLNGQTPVNLPIPFLRVFRAFISGPAASAGTVYIYRGTTQTAGVPTVPTDVRATIIPDARQTLIAIHTIPEGFVGFLLRGEVGLELSGVSPASADFAHIHFEARRQGGVFRVAKAISLMVGGSSNYQDVRTFPDPIPARTDVRIRGQQVSASLGLWGAFSILLVSESEFTSDYLLSIGQPQ